MGEEGRDEEEEERQKAGEEEEYFRGLTLYPEMIDFADFFFSYRWSFFSLSKGDAPSRRFK